MKRWERIREKLRESFVDRKVTKLAVFDFDGTLIDTPTSDTGKIEYEKKTGSPWPYTGWWGRSESLDSNIFDMHVIQSVKAAYEIERADPNTLVVMMTGRVKKLSDSVEKILADTGFKFDLYLYNDMNDTLAFKIMALSHLIKTYPQIKEVYLWDDRQSHIPKFQNWGDDLLESGRLEFFGITVVDGNHHKAQ